MTRYDIAVLHTTRSIGKKSGSGNSKCTRFGERRAYGGDNFGAAEALPNALENCRVCRGRAGIVAKQNGQGVGIGPDDRNGFDRRFQRQRVAFVLQ